MTEEIKIIERMLENNAFDKSTLFKIIGNMGFLPVIPVLLPKGNKILRSSINEGDFHYTISRLGYPPAEYARTDRTSLEKKPMFYGSVFTSAAKTENAYPRLFSALETTDILRKYNEKGNVITTQSVWITQSDIIVFAFPYPEKLPHACDEIKTIRKMWNEMKSAYKNNVVELMEYIGKIMTKSSYSCLYDITANTIDYILSHELYLDKPLDGVYYPSVYGEGAGVNVCLKTETVDSCVRFADAKVVVINKEKGKSYILTIADCEKVEDDKLEWHPQSICFGTI